MGRVREGFKPLPAYFLVSVYYWGNVFIMYFLSQWCNSKLEKISLSVGNCSLRQLSPELVSPFQDFILPIVLRTSLTFWISPHFYSGWKCSLVKIDPLNINTDSKKKPDTLYPRPKKKRFYLGIYFKLSLTSIVLHINQQFHS